MAVRIPNKLVFLEHPRTASTSIREALRKIGGQPVKRHSFIKARSDEKTMVVVRNPYDILVSWWLIVGEREGYRSFRHFLLESRHRELMTKNGELFYYSDHADFVLHYETLARDFLMVLNTLGLPKVDLVRRNKTAKKMPYHHYYTPETVKIVQDIYGEELERYCYGLAPGERSG
jgi:hypothetical protein